MSNVFPETKNMGKNKAQCEDSSKIKIKRIILAIFCYSPKCSKSEVSNVGWVNTHRQSTYTLENLPNNIEADMKSWNGEEG